MAFGSAHAPGTICYQALIPLDCAGRPVDLYSRALTDVSDGAALWGQAANKLTVASTKCGIKEFDMTEKRADDTIIADSECDEVTFPGAHKGYTGTAKSSWFLDPVIQAVIGQSQIFVDPTTKNLVATIPTEQFNSCACDNACSGGGFAWISWVQLLDACGNSGRATAALDPSGLPLWHVQVWPKIQATGFNIHKTSEAGRIQSERELTLTAGRNQNFNVGELVVPDQTLPGSYVPLFPAAGAELAGTGQVITPATLTGLMGSEIAFTTTIAPPNLGCDNNCSRWESLADATPGQRQTPAVAATETVKADAKK